ncbi:MAG: twin transmembrane helix small protein [Proteobacteria bacterium]|nr:twin transmembrane helix small protein [Pseudomonadota bacterium]
MVDTVLPILIGISLVCVLGVLGAGLVSMLRGGAFNRKYSNTLMRARVATQGAAVALMVLFFVLGGRPG